MEEKKEENQNLQLTVSALVTFYLSFILEITVYFVYHVLHIYSMSEVGSLFPLLLPPTK